MHDKRHCSSHTADAGDDAPLRNKERIYLEAARRASLTDVKAHQIRNREISAGASISLPIIGERSTTNGGEIDVGTTEGDLNTQLRVPRNQTHPLV